MTTRTRMILLCIFGPLLVLGSVVNAVTIEGQILFEPTQQPLRAVIVKLLRPNNSLATRLAHAGKEGVPELLGTTKTDATGRFRFETPGPGPYEIECFRPGPHAGSGMRNVDPKKFVLIQYKADPVPFSLRPGEKPPSK